MSGQGSFRFRPDSGEVDLDREGIYLRGAVWALEADGVRLGPEGRKGTPTEEGALWDMPEAGLRLELHVLQDGNEATLWGSITNISSRPVRLGRCVLLSLGEGRLGIGRGDDIVFLGDTGNIAYRPVRFVHEGDGRHLTKVFCQFFNREEEKALLVGFYSLDRANPEVAFAYIRGKGFGSLEAYCDFSGFPLGPGETVSTERLLVAVGRDPHALSRLWAEKVGGYYRPRIWEDPPVGWVGWAWVDPFTVERYEDVVLRNARAVRRRLPGFGVRYIWVSIGNLRDATPGRWLDWNYELFPGGVEHLVDELGKLGFRLGFWVAPFWVCSNAREVLEEVGDALLRDEEGLPLVVRPEWQYGPAGLRPPEERPCIYALDPSHPKTLDFLRRVFGTYRRWGVRYFMLDFLEAGAGNIGRFPYRHHYDRRKVAGPEVYREALRVVRDKVGNDTFLLSSSGPSVHNVGLVDAVRTGNDFGEGRPLYPHSYFYPATFGIGDLDVWTGPIRALTNMATLYFAHRRLFLNDPGNVLTVDKPVPLEHARIASTIFAISGSPVMLGDDLDRISEERLALIKKVLPPSRETALPVDLFDSPHPDHPKVFHRKVVRPWGRYDIVAVFNFEGVTLEESVPLERLGLDPGAKYLVWEFWDEVYLGSTGGELRLAVPPGSVRVYRLVEDRGRPVLLGTDMHVLQGEVEIEDCRWEEELGTLRGIAVRPEGERGSIFLYVPPGLRVADPSGLWIAKDVREGCLIVRCSLDFSEGRSEWRVGFVPSTRA